MFDDNKWFKWIIGVFILLAIIGFFWGIGDNSQGERTGYLIKFSETGIIFHTFEGEVAMNSFNPDSKGSMSPYVFDFSVCNPQSFDTDILMNNIGSNVKIKYHSPIIVQHWKQASKYCIDSIEILNSTG